MADQGEKTEAPTGRKRNQARQQGNVAKSQDLTAAVGILAAVLALAALGSGTFDRLELLARDMFSGLRAPDDPITAASVTSDFVYAMVTAGLAILPYALVFVPLGVLVNFAQIGPLFTTQPLKPKMDKLSPVKGFGKIFGVRNQVKTGLSLIKLIAAVIIAAVVITARTERFAVLPRLDAAAGMILIGRIAFEIGILLAIVLLVLGLADLAYQIWQREKDLKMTKSEVKDDRKLMDGDIETKRRRMQMYQQIVGNQIKEASGEADVIVTNPTHFSVAIKYDQQTMNAPTVTAKGADEVALRMREFAKAAGVPIIERPPLARALFAAVPVGSEISPEHYEAVAELLAFVYRMDEQARRDPKRREAVAA